VLDTPSTLHLVGMRFLRPGDYQVKLEIKEGLYAVVNLTIADAVLPLMSLLFTSAPFSTNSLTSLKFPLALAMIRGVESSG
jgi:hypothetical protein